MTSRSRPADRRGMIARFHRAQRGTALTEAAICLPAFLVVFSGLFMLTDLMRSINQVEIAADLEAKNEVLRAQRLGVTELDGDLAPHVTQTTAASKTAAEYAGSYPADQPDSNWALDAMVNDMYGPGGPNDLFDASLVRQDRNPDLRPLYDTAFSSGEGSGTYKAKLMGEPTFWARDTTRDEATGEFDVEIDLDDGLGDILLETANEALDATGTRHAVAAGLRYGQVVGSHEETISNSLFRFDYDMDVDRYVAMEVPPAMPDDTSQMTAYRAVAVNRLSMANHGMFTELLQIGDPEAGGSPGEDGMLPQNDDFRRPEDPDDIMSEFYHYDEDD